MHNRGADQRPGAIGRAVPGHEVAVIEQDAARAVVLSSKLDCQVFVGDSSTHDVLDSAGASRARVFVAATGSDQDNLIACQVAKKVFGVTKTIARASNPKNEDVMARLAGHSALGPVRYATTGDVILRKRIGTRA